MTALTYPLRQTLTYHGLRKAILLLGCLLLASLPHSTWGQGVAVSMHMDTVNILIGEQVQLTVRVAAPAGSKISFPHYEDTLTQGVEVIHQSPVRELPGKSGGNKFYETRYTITAFDSALYTLPPTQVEVNGVTYRAPKALGLKVEIMPVDTAHLDHFAGPEGVLPNAFERDEKSLWLAVSPLCVLALLLLLTSRLASGKPLKRLKVIVPAIPPHREAKAGMQQLHDMEDAAPADGGKAYYMKLSEILRRYIGRRFQMQAMEVTTGELLKETKEILSPEESRTVEEVLQKADMVKFAGLSTLHTDRKRHATMVDDFLDRTRDDAMEHPKKKIQSIVLSDGMQLKFRIALWCGIAALIACGFWLIYEIPTQLWDSYNY